MSYSHRPKAEGHRERLINTSIAASGARDMESTKVMSNETDPTIVDQRSARTGTTDLVMFIADAVDEDCDSDVSTVHKLRMQCGSEDLEKGLGGVAAFVERDSDDVAPTLEWRERILHSQRATQATTSSSRQQQTAEERWHASLEIEIERIRGHYHEQERVLEREIVKLEQMYEWDVKQLEKEENDEENYSVADRWEIQSDYQPTECGDDGSRYLMPERELKHWQHPLGQCP
ncbi:hypothetical protein BGY98DRAFT_1095305 [Russula aff. rugulosa BPL654]|nr:hypothetical protein BGY98DRAFT_1095305 [Russula aff. rugulosa BPL654]